MERNKQFVRSESTKVTKNESEKAQSFMSVRGTFSRRATSTLCFSFSNSWRSVFPLKFCTEQIFVLVSVIMSELSKWSFQWITNFVNYIINIQSYQKKNKITFHWNSFLFACFSIALECCKYARIRFHCATVLVVLSNCTLRGKIADDAMQVDVNKPLYLCYTTMEMPMLL